MKAKREDEFIILYNDEESVVGKLKFQKDQPEKTELTIGAKHYTITREGWTFRVSEGDEVLYNLKTNSFFGDIVVLEIDRKIKGVFSMKWGTQMVNENNDTLLRIGNESLLFDKGIYEIEILEKGVTEFEILLSLFGHVYGSSMKLKSIVASS